MRQIAQLRNHLTFQVQRERWAPSCVEHTGVEKVRALSGGEGPLIDTGGVSMVLLKADLSRVTNI